MVFLVGVMLGIGTPILANAPAPNTNPMSWSDNFVTARPVLTYETPLKPKKYDTCSCIEYIKRIFGINGSIGNAWELSPDTDLSVGVIVLLDEGKGHVGLVTSYTEEEITISESNWIPCRYTERTLKRNDPKIRGYKDLQVTKLVL